MPGLTTPEAIRLTARCPEKYSPWALLCLAREAAAAGMDDEAAILTAAYDLALLREARSTEARLSALLTASLEEHGWACESPGRWRHESLGLVALLACGRVRVEDGRTGKGVEVASRFRKLTDRAMSIADKILAAARLLSQPAPAENAH